MCEDRGIEGAERLRRVIQTKNLIELRKLIKDLDRRYNTGLFDASRDPLQTTLSIDSEILSKIVEELYFPQAPYSFSVLDADFLGQVYELFLTQRMFVNDSGKVILVDKPAYEGREIVTTPQPLVDEIVRKTVRGRYSRLLGTRALSLDELTQSRILDMSVGSGRFLLRCLDELTDLAILACRSNNDNVSIYRKSENDYRLCFEYKVLLLKNCLYGIDIDFNAVEVARFSLLIKVLEDETKETLPSGHKILPNLDSNIIWGNSVVDEDFIDQRQDVMNTTRPLNWNLGYLPPYYDVIVGNPPYIKTEDMKSATPEELSYYRRKYDTAYKQFDKYFLFVERSISKLKEGGWAGFVIPNKWMTIESGKKLRALLSTKELVTELVDFGNELLFHGKSTYVCLLVLSNETNQQFHYRRVDDYSDWLQTLSIKGRPLPYHLIDQRPGASWVLPSTPEEAKVLSVLSSNSSRLGDVAEVLNGIQTSADGVYAISEWTESGDRISFEKNGISWQIEKAITQPYLMDSALGVKSYSTVRADALVIFPYTYGVNGEAVVVPPAKLQSDFPLAWTYLNHYRGRLETRDISPPPSNGTFYQYGRHQALGTAFKGPKIIYSVNQLGDKYGYDAVGVGFASGGTAGEVSITNPKDGYTIEFLLALLNQRAIEYFLRKRGSPFRGGYYSRGSAVVSDCPVPKIDASNPVHTKIIATVTALVRDLISVQDNIPSAAGQSLELLEQRRTHLYSQVALQFSLLWNFDGKDQAIVLPGE